MSSASTVVGDYGWSRSRLWRFERIAVAGSKTVAGMCGKVAQKSVELPSKYPGAPCVGTPAAFINDF